MKTPTFSPERSGQIRAQLVHLAASEATAQQPVHRKRHATRRRNFGWGLAATMVVACGVAGAIQYDAASAQASQKLQGLSQVAGNYSDLVPEPGEYLKIETRGIWMDCTRDEQENDRCALGSERSSGFYKPGDPSDEWAFEFFDPRLDAPEVLRAVDGDFAGGSVDWILKVVEHVTDGASLYDYVNSTYDGSSSSREDSNFSRLADPLRTGLVPAVNRAAFYDALSRVPGVTVTNDVKTMDGRTGISIGRTEPLSMGTRDELIVDPDTGLVIGSRDISTMAIMGFGKNEVIGQGYITYSLVDSAPPERKSATLQ